MKQKHLMVVVMMASMVAAPQLLPAGDAEAGKEKAAACAGCHTAGNPTAPTLEGMPEQYLIKATTAYTTGERNDPSMKALLGTLTEGDIADIAAYYSGQKCK